MKYALIVGINKYKIPGNDLRGCVNDAMAVRDMCQEWGFTNIITLLDDQATKESIMTNLTNMVKNAKRGDKVLYYHSGHGTQVPDLDGDELDGLDEALVTHDFDWDDPFTDDVLARCLRYHRKRVQLYLIIDTCFSGGGARGITNKLGPRTLPLTENQHNLLRKTPKRSSRPFGRKPKKKGRQRHIFLAGCKEGQFSYEDMIDGKIMGLMTSRFVKLSSRKFKWAKTYRKLHRVIRKMTRKQKPKQNPQLFGPWRLKRKTILGGYPK